MHFVGNNQLSHQESVTFNLQKFTSNPVPLLPKLVLWFWILLGDLLLVPLIMVIFMFTLQSIHCNISLTLFQIHTS